MANGDKTYNVGRIRELTRRAAGQGAEIVCFHECSVTAYTFLQTLSRELADQLGQRLAGPGLRLDDQAAFKSAGHTYGYANMLRTCRQIARLKCTVAAPIFPFRQHRPPSIHARYGSNRRARNRRAAAT